MHVLVTGADGFLGKNFCMRLKEQSINFTAVTRKTDLNSLSGLVKSAEFIFHFAGTNRSNTEAAFTQDNVDFSHLICQCIEESLKKIPVIFASSIHASTNTVYGRSKKEAERLFFEFSARTKNPTCVIRLPNLFGKWCKPNYNSVVATFCHRIANDLPIEVVDPEQQISLAYIDDVVFYLIDLLEELPHASKRKKIITFREVYRVTIGDLARRLYEFKKSRETLVVPDSGAGLDRALYATFLSYMRPDKFVYSIPKNEDFRGNFVEFVKTVAQGQVSYFTSNPSVTRGKHYHHTKSEKFLILKGTAEFRFKNVISGETYKVKIDGRVPQIVETMPGWAHEVENIGSDELIGLIWANEVFDDENPDTFSQLTEFLEN